MTEKVKVSKEVAEAIEKALNYFLLADGGEDPEEALIVQHAIELYGEVKQKMLADVLFELRTFELAEILVNGYEVEQTQEEKIKKLFYGYAGENEFHESDAQKAILELLEILEKKVEGVNK